MNANPYQTEPQTVQFRRGQPIMFIATKPFTLGQSGAAVHKGTEISFDGTTAEIDGTEYPNLAFLRGAYKAGWIVPAEEYDPSDPSYGRRTRANIQVRPVIGGNPLNPQSRASIVTTESDEREVGNARDHASRTASGNRGYVRGQTPVNVVRPGTVVKTQRGMMEVEEQDGITLDRQLMTPAGERSRERIDLSSDRAARAMQVAQNAQIRPGEGISEEEMLDRMEEQDRAEYLARKEALRANYVSEAPTKSLPRPAQRKVVARVATKLSGHAEGMQFKNSVGGGSHIGDETDGEVVGTVHAAKDLVEEFEQDGIKFTTTNGPRRASAKQHKPVQRVAAPVVPSADPPPPVPENLDVRRKIAKAVCPDFPENYDFTLSPKKKLARLQADYEDRHDVLRAVFAAESDDMKSILLQEFTKAFES